jgi:beta-lactamase class A
MQKSIKVFSDVLKCVLILCIFLTPQSVFAKRDALRKQLDAIADKFHGKIGYSLHHLKTGDQLERFGGEKFPSGSTIKLAMLCAAMEKQQSGEISYDDDARPLTEELRSYGTGLIHNYRGGTNIRLRDLLYLLIAHSDNSASTILGQWLGAEAVNQWLDRQGLKNTRLLVPFPWSGSFQQDMAARPMQWEQLKRWGMGVSTPHEMRMLMEMIADGRAGTPAATDQMIRILTRQYYTDGIASQIPPWVSVASKHGAESKSRSDVAVVYAPSGTYVLAIYTKEAQDAGFKWDNEQATAIRAISRAIWRYYNPRVKWSPPTGTEKFYQFQTEPCYPGMPCWKNRPQNADSKKP